MSDFEKSIERLNAIQDQVAIKRKKLMVDLTEREPEITDFLRWFKDEKEFESRVVWIEIDGKVRLKWGRIL